MTQISTTEGAPQNLREEQRGSKRNWRRKSAQRGTRSSCASDGCWADVGVRLDERNVDRLGHSHEMLGSWTLRSTKQQNPTGRIAHIGVAFSDRQYTFETAIALASCGVDGSVFTAMHLQPAELPKQRIGSTCCVEWRTCSHWTWGFPEDDGIWAADWASSLKTVAGVAATPRDQHLPRVYLASKKEKSSQPAHTLQKREPPRQRRER